CAGVAAVRAGGGVRAVAAHRVRGAPGVMHLDAASIILLIVAGFLASAVNGVAGGGALLSFPALLLVGYPAVVANVSNTVALIPGYLGAAGTSRAELSQQR